MKNMQPCLKDKDPIFSFLFFLFNCDIKYPHYL